MHKRFIIVMVTCATPGEARKIAHSLLKKRTVACANMVGGVESKFWWKGRLGIAKEVLLMMKTRSVNFKKIEAEVIRLHSYEVPEIIAVPIASGSKEYLKWIENSVK